MAAAICPQGLKVMGIKFDKIIHKSSSKKGLAFVDPKLVRDAEVAREMAWHDAYLHSGVIS